MQKLIFRSVLLIFVVQSRIDANQVPDYPAWNYYQRGMMTMKSILEHPSGSFYVANSSIIEKYANGQWESFSVNNCYALASDSLLRIWAGTQGGGVRLFDNDSFTELHGAITEGPEKILELYCARDGAMWAGTFSGLFQYNSADWIDYSSYTPGSYITCIDQDRKGRIWAISGTKGVVCGKDNEWQIFDTINSDLPTNHVFDIAVDCTGGIWLASSGNYNPELARGLLCYDEEEWSQYDTSTPGITTVHFSDVEVDQNGVVWAFSVDGLIRYKDGQFTPIPCKRADRYPGNIGGASEAMIVDKQGRIWIGTRHYGVYVYDPNYADCSQEKALTLSSPTAGAQIKTGDPVSIQWSSTGCIDSVVIAYRKDTQPWQVIDTITNLRSYSWTAPGSPADQYQIRISDLKTASISATSERFAIIEQQQNAAPVITNQPDSIVVQEGEATSWTATVEDADGDDVTISFESVPAWASVEDFTLTLNPQGDSNSDTVLVIADDGNGGRDTLSLRVIVEHPVITIQPRATDGAFYFGIPDLQIVFRCSLKEVNAIDIVTVSGRLVKTLAVEAGRAIWDGKDSEKQRVRSGVYALRLRHKDGRSIIRKIVVKT